MKIVDSLLVDNKVLACCVGEDLPCSTECSMIEIGKDRLKIGTYSYSISLIGMKNALFELPTLDDPKQVPMGEFKFVK